MLFRSCCTWEWIALFAGELWIELNIVQSSENIYTDLMMEASHWGNSWYGFALHTVLKNNQHYCPSITTIFLCVRYWSFFSPLECFPLILGFTRTLMLTAALTARTSFLPYLICGIQPFGLIWIINFEVCSRLVLMKPKLDIANNWWISSAWQHCQGTFHHLADCRTNVTPHPILRAEHTLNLWFHHW